MELASTERLPGYRAHLDRLAVSEHTRSAYATQVGKFLAYVDTERLGSAEIFTDVHARDYAVRDFKTHLKTAFQAKPATVNLALAAIDNFYGWVGLGAPNVTRETLPAMAPKAMTVEEQKTFMRAVERCTSVRNRAVAHLLIATALRVSEATALDVTDVPISARKGTVIVRDGKGGRYREVPVNADARGALTTWLKERAERFPQMRDAGALFISRGGERLSRRALDMIVRDLGTAGDLQLSCHALRHTCLTRLVRDAKQDIVLVAEIAGHRTLEVTRRYSLPTHADRAKAMEMVGVDY